jgi:hypothetical protein
MRSFQILMLCGMTLILVSIYGCRWNNDFRSRLQPEYGEGALEPTMTDESVRLDAAQAQSRQDEQDNAKHLEKIDSLSKIPPLPDNPVP